ncbi:GerAB/ArcD/ProY family transporter [Brevibacillus fortis]|uniref:Spore gernimation protein n=1 Tax=Brevibacillus fortis TaxID=2126352 RepID=A0A2P7UT23_9BACL|nr:endospore germination permease [Brevibacillus fortis]PSJ90131.1 spore gernimation protein [Brevibacillus fortis]
MDVRTISRFQWVSIHVLSLPIMGHVILIEPLIHTAGKDGWISALISIPAGILFVLLLTILRSKIPNTSLLTGTFEIAGRATAVILSVILIAYFSFASVTTLRGFEEFVKITFLPETPLWAIGTGFMFLIWFSLQRNIESIARMAVIFFLMTMITGPIVGLTLMQEKDYTRILPILDNGWGPVLEGSLYFIALWGELILVLLLQSKWVGKRHDFNGFSFLILFNVFLGASMLMSAIAVFGLPLSEKLDWPVQNTVRQIKLGFISRGDIYGLYTMTAGCFIRVTVFLYAICECLAFLFSTTYKKLSLPVCLAALLLSLLVFSNHQQLLQTNHAYYKYGYVLLLLPIFLLILFWIKRGKAVENHG